MSNGDMFDRRPAGTVRNERSENREIYRRKVVGWIFGVMLGAETRAEESVISQGSTLFLQDIFFRKAGFFVSWGF
jgi:hypothetical protein